jgi:catechol 2,3-dioxygenase-like lactoylglutathione lyase family enzyme
VLRVSVRRIMTDLPSRAPAESREFYRRVVGLEPVMDLGWIVSLADPSGPGSVSAC